MHGERAIAVVEPWSLRAWLALGGAAVLVPLVLTFPAAGAVDALLVGLAAASAGGTWWAVGVRRWLDGLPLELAPIVGTGIVDGGRVYRFRARLGRGRVLHDPGATVTVVAADGTETPLPVEVPRGRLCGPFTVLARGLPTGPPPERFRVEVTAVSGSSSWRASREFSAAELREGRFGGITPGPGPIRFAADWAAVDG